MTALRKSTVPTQVAEHLREKIRQGHWQDFLPGRGTLADELGVSPMTVLRAVEQLEQEGLVVSQGSGRPKRIVRPKSGWKPNLLRIAVLRYEPEDTQIFYIVNIVHRLREAGHQVDYADKTLTGLKMNVKRIARLVEKTKADAWIIISGSDEVLKWFSSRSLPCFALFGRYSPLPIAAAGPSKKNAYLEPVPLTQIIGCQEVWRFKK